MQFDQSTTLQLSNSNEWQRWIWLTRNSGTGTIRMDGNMEDEPDPDMRREPQMPQFPSDDDGVTNSNISLAQEVCEQLSNLQF